MPGTTLSEQERGQISFVHGNSCDVSSTAATRLYESKQGRWEYTNIVGACSLVFNRVQKTCYIRIVDLQNKRTVFEQEIYDDFEYVRQRDFFFTFEGDLAVYGLSFVDIEEAAEFQNQILSIRFNLSKKNNNASSVNALNYNSSSNISNGNNLSNGGNSTTVSSSSSSSSSSSFQKEKPKKSKSGFFSKILNHGSSAAEEKPMEISAPTGFKHESHIGWDAEKGFDIRNIPPDWRALFQSVGIKKRELQNPETAQFILSVIGESVAQQQQQPPQPGKSSAPPPPPPGASNNTMPLKPSRSAAPPPPPQQLLQQQLLQPQAHPLHHTAVHGAQLEEPLQPIPSNYNYPQRQQQQVAPQMMVQPKLQPQQQQFQQQPMTYSYQVEPVIVQQQAPQMVPQQQVQRPPVPKHSLPPPPPVQQQQQQQQQPPTAQVMAAHPQPHPHPPVPPRSHGNTPTSVSPNKMTPTTSAISSPRLAPPPPVAPRSTQTSPGYVATPPPPPPAPQMTETAAISSPMPPPPPPPVAAPTSAPIAVSSMLPAAGGRDDLLAAIRRGTSLNKVDASQPLPDLTNLTTAGNRSLQDTLFSAMAIRREQLGEEEHDEDEDDDEWDI